MDVEIFTLCDFARNYGGKLTLIGPFDVIASLEAPFTHHSASVAIRLRFTRSEQSVHPFKLNLIDEDGNHVIPELSGRINPKIRQSFLSQAVDLAFTIPNLSFPKFGRYSLTLTIDNKEVKSLPIVAAQIQKDETEPDPEEGKIDSGD